MLLLNGNPLSYDRAFTDASGMQYPANWLRLATLAEKQAIGITEVADDPVYDQRFYWNVSTPKQLDDVTDEDGNTSTGLKTLWSAEQGKTASLLLTPSDWRVIKAKETGSNIPSAWKTYRADVRTACNTRQSEINSVTDVEALKELLFGPSTITRQQTDVDGNDVVDADGDPVMETVTNPAIATPWPVPLE